MIKKSRIIQRIQNLKYFDQGLHINAEKTRAITENDEQESKRLLREAKLVRKLLTIHTYVQCADSYDILENPKQIITKAQYRKNATSSIAKDAPHGAITIAGVPAQFMTEEEFDIMIEVYWKLKQCK